MKKRREAKASREATRELLLKIPRLLGDVQKASSHVKSGKSKDWRKVRKDV
jgi:hypothetical protein